MLHWRVLFDCRTQRRGKEYYERGLVSGLSFGGEVIRADVRGKNRVYSVTVKLLDSEVEDMDCGCPAALRGRCCKHMAAALTAYDDTEL